MFILARQCRKCAASICMCIYIYTYIHTYIHTYIRQVIVEWLFQHVHLVRISTKLCMAVRSYHGDITKGSARLINNNPSLQGMSGLLVGSKLNSHTVLLHFELLRSPPPPSSLPLPPLSPSTLSIVSHTKEVEKKDHLIQICKIYPQ